MKAFRIIQIIVLVVIVAYLFLVNNYNPTWTELPFLFSLPSAVVIAIALAFGWLIGWLFGLSSTWGKTREVSRLKKRVAELERNEPTVTAVNIGREPEAPVIPDRSPAVSGGNSEYENL